jgi:hypothetical protein
LRNGEGRTAWRCLRGALSSVVGDDAEFQPGAFPTLFHGGKTVVYN